MMDSLIIRNLSKNTINITANYIYRHIAVAKADSSVKKSTKTSQNNSGEQKKKRQEGGNETKAQTASIAKFIEMSEKASRLRLNFTEEEQIEHRRIGREYNRQYAMKHNRYEKDLTTKIYLQKEATNALPPKLKELAIIIDDTPSPEDRPYPAFYTPPIKGFNPQDYLDKNKSEEDDT